MTDRIFAAREAVKVNSLNVDAFESREAGIVGYVAGESVILAGCPLSLSPRRKSVLNPLSRMSRLSRHIREWTGQLSIM